MRLKCTVHEYIVLTRTSQAGLPNTSSYACSVAGVKSTSRSPDCDRCSTPQTEYGLERLPARGPPAGFTRICLNWGCSADLLTNQTVLGPKVHCHTVTSMAPQVGIEPTSPPTKVVYIPRAAEPISKVGSAYILPICRIWTEHCSAYWFWGFAYFFCILVLRFAYTCKNICRICKIICNKILHCPYSAYFSY